MDKPPADKNLKWRRAWARRAALDRYVARYRGLSLEELNGPLVVRLKGRQRSATYYCKAGRVQTAGALLPAEPLDVVRGVMGWTRY